MCGIAGVFHYREQERPVDARLLRRMTRLLRHRGPDGEGFHIDGPLGLGHRRLAIVDLSPTGAQPMPSASGRSWIAYNGELYNHGAFRRRLAEAGVAFRGTSDTETLLEWLERHGEERLAEAAGIFSFAFWSGADRTLTLARDPLGVKQLYYHDDGRRIVFASEIKALLASPEVPRAIDPDAVNEYLHFHTPLFERTFFRGVSQLRPGELLRVTERGLRSRTYWAIDDFSRRDEPPETCVHELRESLELVVREQLMSDVPVGAFLSGGIDSTAVSAFAARAGKPPTCFGVHFSGQGVIDERPYQEAAAKALGLELELTTLDGKTFPEDLLRLMYQQDQPVIGAAMFPMDRVSAIAARRVKVCMGGQAADEIFGGYARYGLVRPLQVLRSWFMGRRPVGDARAPSRSPAAGRVGGSLWAQLTDPRTLRRLGRNFAGAASWRRRYFDNFAIVPERAWRSVLGDPSMVSRRRCRDVFDAVLADSAAVDPADKVLHWDVRTYLPGLFQQEDRMSMAHGLESRVPLADPRLVRLAFRTDFDLKLRAGTTKWILRQAVADVLPSEILNRRKVGFDTPAEAWMRGAHAPFVRDLLLGERARRRGLLCTKGIEAVLEAPGRDGWFDVVWKVLCIETWARIFLDGDRPPGVVAPDLDLGLDEDDCVLLQRHKEPVRETP